MKQLKIGTDYASIMGLPEGCKAIYVGGDMLHCVKADGAARDIENPAQIARLLEYVNRPTVHMGAL